MIFASYRKIVDAHVVDTDSLYLILDAEIELIDPIQLLSEPVKQNGKSAAPNNSHFLNLQFLNLRIRR